jgi:GT2 family glycosyltransferase
MLGASRRFAMAVKSTPDAVNRHEDAIPIVILNWNGEHDTLECLKSIRNSVPAGFVPVLVDNGSDSDSVERLKRACGQIYSKILYLKRSELSASQDRHDAGFAEHLDDDALVFIENGENLGFAKGNNVGVRFAELVGSDWVMLLNNDTVVSTDAFQELRKFLWSRPSVAAVAPQVRQYNAGTRIQNCGGDLTYFGSRKYRFANMDASALPKSDFSVVTFLTGCALLFKYKVTGMLTEDFFFGEEDYEFALRMRRLGLEMACVHAAIVYHKGGATIRRSSNHLGSILVQYVSRLLNTRNYYTTARWHATRMMAYLYLPILLGRKGIDPRKSISIIRRTESYLQSHRNVGRMDHECLISLDS